VEKLGVPEAEVADLSQELYHGYGTTMCGLLTHGYQLDVEDWHAAVHDSLEYDKLLHEQPTTRQVRSWASAIELAWIFELVASNRGAAVFVFAVMCQLQVCCGCRCCKLTDQHPHLCRCCCRFWRGATCRSTC
jgi:hypothetical protein